MQNNKRMNSLALMIMCTWLCSCNAADINSSSDNSIENDKVKVTRDSAINLIWELQRLHVLCSKLEPDKAEILSKRYRDTKLDEFEQFLPLDQNPYVAMVTNSDVYNAAYVSGDPEIKSQALDDCRTQYPKQLEKLRNQAAAVRKALSDNTD